MPLTTQATDSCAWNLWSLIVNNFQLTIFSQLSDAVGWLTEKKSGKNISALMLLAKSQKGIWSIKHHINYPIGSQAETEEENLINNRITSSPQNSQYLLLVCIFLSNDKKVGKKWCDKNSVTSNFVQIHTCEILNYATEYKFGLYLVSAFKVWRQRR